MCDRCDTLCWSVEAVLALAISQNTRDVLAIQSVYHEFND